jgi:hypothetical protein
MPLSTRRALMGSVPWWLTVGIVPWAAYQAKGSASFAASLLDLSGNGHNAGDPGGAASPSWAGGTGWTFDGIADYLTTAFTPQNDQSQSVLIQFTNVTNTGVIVGTNEGANLRYRIQPDDGAAHVLYSNGGNATAGPVLLAGNLGVAGASGYRNGVVDAGAIGAWGGAPSVPVYIGAERQAVAAATFCACTVQAVVLYDSALTGTQMAAMATAMTAAMAF